MAGFDDEGREVKGPRLLQMVQEKVSRPGTTAFAKIRLLAIYMISQRGIACVQHD
jgi:hypothetical protein